MDEVPGPSVRLPLLVVLTLLAGLSGLVSWQWYVLEARDRQVQEQSFALAVDDITQRINDRMGAYETALRGMSGVFASSQQVSPEEWQRAVAQLQLQARYPGVLALGWGRYLAGPQAVTGMFPAGVRQDYLVVTYIAPPEDANLRVLGFDLLSESRRRQAFERASLSGEIGRASCRERV